MRQRSQRRFRPFFTLTVLALVVAGIVYMRCGEELGLGGGQSGEVDRDPEAGEEERGDKQEAVKGTEPSEVRPAVGGGATPRGRCKLRLDASGLTMDGQPSTTDEAVTACKQAGGAELTVTGDAVFGERERVRQELDRGGVEVFVREGVAPER